MDEFGGLGVSLLAAQDVLEAVLQEVDAAALCRLKAVSVDASLLLPVHVYTRLTKLVPVLYGTGAPTVQLKIKIV